MAGGVPAHALPMQQQQHRLFYPRMGRARVAKACPRLCMKASESEGGKASADVGWRRLGMSWICARHRIDAAVVVSGLRGGKDGVGGFPGDEFGMYPWDPAWSSSDGDSIDWIQEDLVTLFTTDGLVQIGGLKVPRRISSEKKQERGVASSKYRQHREEDYMDPKQGLCLGAIFDIAATNGLDMGRRFCVFGFCRSIEMLSDVVEDTVLEQGGEVVVTDKGSGGGLNERLSMTVAMPLLWGVPPAVDTLNHAIRSGGGIVEKVYWQWEFL